MRNMKNVLLFAVTLFAVQVFAQSEKVLEVKTSISKAVVYLDGAEVHRKGKVQLPKGRTILEVKGLSTSISTKTIQASLGEGVKILSITSDSDWISDKELEKAGLKLKDSISLVAKRLSYIKSVKENYLQEEEMLEKNYQRIGANGGITVEELKAASSFYRDRLNDITKENFKLKTEQKQLEKVMVGLRARKKQLYVNHQHKNIKAIITVKSEQVAAVDFNLNYVVTKAGWVPKYNIRGEGVEQDVQFEYMAEVYNQTGLDWKEVKLILSTGSPFKSMDKPRLNAWNLNFDYGYSYGYNQRSYSEKDKVEYDTLRLDELLSVRVQSEGKLDKRRASANTTIGSYTSAPQKKGIEVSEVTVDFDIELPYTIPSDGKPYLVEVANYSLPATYKYFAVPKLESDAFLIANLTGWEPVNIIDSKANIYYRGKYIGETFIDTRYSNDTLEVSLGRDSKINISRVKREDFNKNSWIGANRKESFEYEISVRNTYSKPIEIEVVDQVPISQENDITVSVENVSNAEQTEQTGRLIWKLKVEPSETKKLLTAFTVKYPKNKKVKIRKNRTVPAQFW